jgi:phosphotransferase system HPr-like phosphotransfer protein
LTADSDDSGAGGVTATGVSLLGNDVVASGQAVTVDVVTADAGSIIDLLTLECPVGTRVTIWATDPADAKLVDQIAQLINSGFEA